MTTDTLVYRGPQAESYLAATDDTVIRPFRINIPDSALADLRRRIAATQFPDRETVADESQGVPLATMQKIAHYWATEYDFRNVEARLNALPQFVTMIDGLEIHFIHVRSKHQNALPLIITHGWPGSIIEQLKLVGPLTDPTAFGGRAEDAFDVVIPSMPGYGFSGKPTTTGWGPQHIARAWDELMKRLGYTRYVAQGGDWGGLIVEQMGVQAPAGLLAIHTNFPGAVPAEVSRALQAGGPAPSGLTVEEKGAYDRIDFFFKHGIAMYVEMASHPQTLYGIADSPIGLAALFLDHDIRSQRLITRAFDGQSGGLTRDDILDNVTLTWLTNTAISSLRLYYENKLDYLAPKNVAIPVAVSAFPDEIYQAPRSWAERAYPNLIFYNKHDRGGHFAAWEQPALLTADIRDAFRSLRSTQRAGQ